MMKRFAVTSLMAAVALTFPRRCVHHEEPGSAKRKVNLDDDDRWLEAEFDEKLRSPEERYAHERQRDLMKKLISKLRDEHTDNLKNAVDERNKKIEDIKRQMSEMEKKLEHLVKGKK
ncbi:uncharacterized protein TM35_000011590 [Trypanosoma theileri]|uniref:Uncharacterized protein n=1 Tax=Trypanosoma theileri TaxID=67003 RepID=A0A1X0P8N6_9TRYP|nr:uncharacterized protein TM35_000011590 [Trypanosoma theileri]ORC93282.1 hypothetical protein TM35_000011590 [Trypanosoma theileri]